MLSARVNVADKTLLLLSQRTVARIGKQGRKAQDRVKRRAKFVTHHGQKTIFQFVGPLCLFFCRYKGFFHSPAFANLASDNYAVHRKDDKDNQNYKDADGRGDSRGNMYVNFTRADIVRKSR